jgi:hypothetical protein
MFFFIQPSLDSWERTLSFDFNNILMRGYYTNIRTFFIRAGLADMCFPQELSQVVRLLSMTLIPSVSIQSNNKGFS